MNYVYVIRCKDNTLYTGWTNDLEKRFKAHCCGKGAKYTKLHKPLCIEAAFEVADKSDALKLEARIKKLTKKEKEILIADKSDISGLCDIEIKPISV